MIGNINKIKLDKNVSLIKTIPFCFINFHKNKMIYEGWKIHISASFDNYIKIFNISYNYLMENKINFKWVYDEKVYFNMISKHASRISSGKFITIYPINDKEFYKILEDLYKLLKNEKGPFIYTDRQYKDCKVLHYRYGALTEKSNLKSTKPVYFQPSYVEDKLYKEPKKQKQMLLNSKYEILKVMHVSNFGGVYLSKNKVNNKIVVIKEARESVGLNAVYTAEYFRKAEKENIIKLSNFNCIPKFIEDFHESGSYFLVEEYIEGFTIHKDKDNYFDIKKIDPIKISKNILFLIEKTNEILNCFHSNNYILNDINKFNFIKSRNKLYFVDLENVTEINEVNNYCVAKYLYLNKNNNLFEQDKVKLGVMFLELLTGIEIKKMKDIYRVLNILKLMILEYNFNISIYEEILKLIRYTNSNTQKIYDNFCRNKKIEIKKISKHVNINFYEEVRKEIEILNNADKENSFDEDVNLLFLLTEFYEQDYKDKIINLHDKILANVTDEKMNYKNIIKFLIVIIRCKEILELKSINLKFHKYFNALLSDISNGFVRIDEKNLSPYFSKGNAGVICLLLEMIEKENLDKETMANYKKIISFLEKGLMYSYTDKLSFNFGLTGIIYAMLKLYDVKTLRKKEYIRSIEIKLQVMNELLNYNENFLRDSSFFEGRLGLEYVYCLLSDKGENSCEKI